MRLITHHIYLKNIKRIKSRILFIFLGLYVSFVSSQNEISSTNTDIEVEFVEISLPKEIFIVEGNRLEIFKHSIVNSINPDNYFLDIKVVSGEPRGKFFDRVYIYDCKKGDSSMTLEFILRNQKGNIISKERTIIRPIVKTESIPFEYNVLLIGDSFTASKTYPKELARRLLGAGGEPIADNLSRINFIGTTPKDSIINREGHSGKSWQYFLDEFSPFWNKKGISFKNYCKRNGYERIDAVIIMLGTNSISNDTVVKKFLDQLMEDYPLVKGLVTGKILSTPFGGGGTVGISHGQTFFGSFANTFLYNRRMEKLLEQTPYSSNFKFVDILPSFDIMHNMQFEEVPANYRNQATKVKQGSDNVHPSQSGYLQIADIIYNAFHAFILK